MQTQSKFHQTIQENLYQCQICYTCYKGKENLGNRKQGWIKNNLFEPLKSTCKW